MPKNYLIAVFKNLEGKIIGICNLTELNNPYFEIVRVGRLAVNLSEGFCRLTPDNIIYGSGHIDMQTPHDYPNSGGYMRIETKKGTIELFQMEKHAAGILEQIATQEGYLTTTFREFDMIPK